MTTEPAPAPAPVAAELYRCAHCGAPVAWDPEKHALACEHCGNAEVVSVPAAEIPEYAIAEAMRRTDNRGFDVQVRRIRCENCGATVDFDPNSVTGRCAFCGAQSIAEVSEQCRVWRPEAVLPFAVSRDQAVGSYRSWLSGLWFRPSDLQHQAKVSELAGIYLPYWLFDAHVDSWWTADAGYYYYTTQSYRDSSGRRRTRRVRQVRWQPASGRHADAYQNVPIYASQGLPIEMCRAIEPYSFDQLIGYDKRFLAGFCAEEYVVDAVEGWRRGQDRMRGWEHEACKRLVPGDTHRRLRVSTKFTEAKFRHVLLPVWIAAYRYKGETYRFLVNGQTGQVHGKAPWSWAKLGGLALLALVIVVLLILAFGR
jgi:predicted RNA-binding Zn-ribbon protein involved in translation (DUF1610 family)